MFFKGTIDHISKDHQSGKCRSFSILNCIKLYLKSPTVTLNYKFLGRKTRIILHCEIDMQHLNYVECSFNLCPVPWDEANSNNNIELIWGLQVGWYIQSISIPEVGWTNTNQRPKLKNLSRGLNLSHGSNMVGSTLNCIWFYKI